MKVVLDTNVIVSAFLLPTSPRPASLRPTSKVPLNWFYPLSFCKNMKMHSPMKRCAATIN